MIEFSTASNYSPNKLEIMKAKVEFYVVENGEKKYFALSDFLPATFNFSNRASITRGYNRVIEKCRRSLYMHFGSTKINSEAYMLDENGKRIGDRPFAECKFDLYF